MKAVQFARAKLRLRTRRRLRPEEQLHRAVADYLRVVLVPPAFFTTFPAGGGGMIRGANLKAMGLMPGMPDIFVFWKTGVAGIELKATTAPSAAQVAAHKALAAVGINVAICRSIHSVETALAYWGVPCYRARVMT